MMMTADWHCAISEEANHYRDRIATHADVDEYKAASESRKTSSRQ
jgi:hypothetical protein